LSEPEDLKNCRFFEAGCKVTTFYHFTKFFGQISKISFFSFLPELLKNYSLFFEADGKDTRSIIISKFFLSLVIHISTLYLFVICKELVRFVTLFILFFSLLFPLLPGCLFQIGLQR